MGMGTATDLAEKERIAARERAEAEERARKDEARKQEEQKGSVLAGMSDYDKTAIQSKEGGLKALTGDELDQVQRMKIKSIAEEGNPKAQEWTSADQAAREAQQKAERREQEAKRREDPGYIKEAKEHHIHAREKVFKHMEQGKPAIFQPKKRAEWTEKLAEFKGAEHETRQQYQERLKKASPDAIGALRSSVKKKLEEAEELAKKRDELYPMASQAIKEKGPAFSPEEHIKRLEAAWKPSDMKKTFDESEKRIQMQTEKETKRQSQQMG